LVADLSLDKAILQDVLRKKLKPAQRRELVEHVQVAYEISQWRACSTLRCNRTVMRYASIRDPQYALVMRIRESTSVRTSGGRRRVHVLCRREGWHVNHKRIRRLYRLESINLRCKTPSRRKSIVIRNEAVKATCPDERWSMDFMADQLHDGRRIRVLTLVEVSSQAICDPR